MSALDVYEELDRLSSAESQAYSSYVPGRENDRANPYVDGVSDGLEQAQALVEFLRWRSAREEWPADGCRCWVSWYDPITDMESVGRHSPEFGHFTLARTSALERREVVVKWRYLLGPCRCQKGGEG